MANKVKVGIIGCGGIANGKHLPALKKEERVELVAFCDIVVERAEKAAKDYGTPDAKVYTDYKEMLKDESIEVVHVLTPNRMHGPCTVDALYAGKHVMCEKPMAKTAEDARKMVQAAKDTGKILSIGYQNRYRKDSLYLKKLVERGDLGDIYFAKAHAIRRRAVPTWGVFTNEYEQGGGSLIDIGTHALDLTLWMMDNYKPKAVMGTAFKKLGSIPESGNAWGDWDVNNFTVEDSAFGYITMENGATIFLESSWALNTLDEGEARTSLCGTKAGADMRDGLRINKCDMNVLETIKPNLDGKGVAFFDASSGPSPADAECKTFYNAVIDGKELIVKPEQALVVTEILEAIYTSSKTGKAVYFD
ncbi:MAG: Gfo/Idh/MocA family oxidoreductase [Clostridia bacterium]|nr:Gfo/Idh/MocA family oxidoreductase [Clostridia bacterium]